MENQNQSQNLESDKIIEVTREELGIDSDDINPYELNKKRYKKIHKSLMTIENQLIEMATVYSACEDQPRAATITLLAQTLVEYRQAFEEYWIQLG